MCSFCVVPYTRGVERSRPLESIVDEVRMLVEEEGVREVTLLGQNVNSWHEAGTTGTVSTAEGFNTVYKERKRGRGFAELLSAVAAVDPEVRVRFTSPHPKDFTPDVLDVIADHANIPNQLHMPAQSGSNAVLKAMRRGYTRESYLELVASIRERLPGVAFSTDMISGFCGETDEDHQQTLDLLREMQYDAGFLFHYSMRKPSYAHHHLQDDVPLDTKLARLSEAIDVFHKGALVRNEADVGTEQLVLVSGPSRRAPDVDVSGRADSNKTVIVRGGAAQGLKEGDYARVRITEATSKTLRGEFLAPSSVKDFHG